MGRHVHFVVPWEHLIPLHKRQSNSLLVGSCKLLSMRSSHIPARCALMVLFKTLGAIEQQK